jgi:hypothetical protein
MAGVGSMMAVGVALLAQDKRFEIRDSRFKNPETAIEVWNLESGI